METLTTFKVNETYKCNSICDSNCWWTFTVVRRTAKSVWIKEEGKSEVLRKKVDTWNDEETCKPFGTYSMSPTLRAGKSA